MRGKPAKILTKSDEQVALRAAARATYGNRGAVMVLLTTRAGLRACEVSSLTWPMVCKANRDIGTHIELPGKAAKKGSGRRIPIHRDLRGALTRLVPMRRDRFGAVVKSRRGGKLSAKAVVNWFTALYRKTDLQGCSSHSGRRTFVTRAARLISKAGGSLRDVQQLAGHRSITTTQEYIEGDADAQRRLIRLI